MPVITDQTGWFRKSLGCPSTLCVGFNTNFVTITHPNTATEWVCSAEASAGLSGRTTS